MNLNYNKVYNVAVPTPVGVPQPVVYKVPYVRYEYVPVEEPCDACCCGGSGNSGYTKIVNHTDVNWIKNGKNIRSVRDIDSNDSSEEENYKGKKT